MSISKLQIALLANTLLFCQVLNVNGQGCKTFTPSSPSEYESSPIFTRVEAGWFPEWLEQSGEKYPRSLDPQEKWLNPWMQVKFISSMHEDSYATDVTNLPGPTLDEVNVQYFRVREKGDGFSGMVPAYAFLDENTMIAPSFGRASTTLVIVDIEDTLKILDRLQIPGRGSTALELAGKKGRLKIFKDTSGGAYFYLSDNNHVYIPGHNNAIIRIAIKNRQFVKENVQYIDLEKQILDGNLADEGLDEKEALNKLTSVMPDKDGNIWFTSKYGIIGLIHRNDKVDGTDCPRVYSTLISPFGALPKIERFFGQTIDSEDEVEALRMLKETGEFTPEIRASFREQFQVDKSTREEIQNSFSMSEDGSVFIVSNMALYKVHFNDETKKIELDSEWEKNFEGLIYDNDRTQKSGHLNNGSGTTPTLVRDKYVVIVDNAPSQVNICVYNQKTGKLVFKHPLFEPEKSACENSVIAYNNSLIVGNTSGYDDPFVTNDTPGGLMRFDFDEGGNFKLNENWPKKHLDIKTATPKLSTAAGVLYIYNRADEPVNGHYDWQITALDVASGIRSYYIRPYLEKKEFGENVSFITRGASLGNKNYDRKVFNNIWGTFTVGPNKSIFVATYRGFIKIQSD